MDAGVSFEVAWPVVERRLRGALRGRGAPPSLVDDVVQETALRAWCTRRVWPSTATLTAWSRRVAGNLVIDDHRRDRRLDRSAAVPDRSGHEDPAASAVHRITLATLGAQIGRLSVPDRRALLGAPPPPGPDRHRADRRRHRVRRSLIAALPE